MSLRTRSRKVGRPIGIKGSMPFLLSPVICQMRNKAQSLALCGWCWIGLDFVISLWSSLADLRGGWKNMDYGCCTLRTLCRVKCPLCNIIPFSALCLALAVWKKMLNSSFFWHFSISLLNHLSHAYCVLNLNFLKISSDASLGVLPASIITQYHVSSLVSWLRIFSSRFLISMSSQAVPHLCSLEMPVPTLFITYSSAILAILK